MKRLGAILCAFGLAAALLWLACEWAVAARQFKMALPGYTFSFPRDHASHNEFKTEWWYYTGHLAADDGTKYGYELTFFRSGMDIPNGIDSSSPWAVDNVYMAHFAVSDLAGRRFFYDERLNRPGIDFAGAKTNAYKVWNENWLADGTNSPAGSANVTGVPTLPTVSDRRFVQNLHARSPDYSIDLALTPEKPPVIHGENGVSQKASCRGCASHYYSFTRLDSKGTVTVHGKPLHVSGLSWMDHEFGSNQLTSDQVGWDWFSIQLDNNTELMLYVMRRRDHSLDPNSSGTFVLADGKSVHLKLSDYRIKSSGQWHSSATGATYPMHWDVDVPSLQMKLSITPDMENQELAKRRASDVSYWEGASTVTGTIGGKPVGGQAYVEMTGYAEHFSKNI